MASHDLDALDPLPTVLKILQILRTSPENTAQLGIESTNLKNMMKRARERADAIQDPDISLSEQEEIIRTLESRVEKKTRMLASLGITDQVVEPVQLKVEPEDSVMTG